MIKITQTVVGYLTRRTAVPVSGEIPEKATGNFVVVEKIGGGKKNHILESTMRIRCYADTLAQAENLSILVQDAMDDIVSLPDVTCCEYGGDYNATEDKRYCYDVMYTITHY